MSAATDAAETAAESVRALVHATLSHEGYTHSSDVYDAIGALESTVSRSAQAIEQATTWLEREGTERRLTHDATTDAGEIGCHVMVAMAALMEARQDTSRAGLALRYCHGLLAPFGAAIDVPEVQS